MKYRWFIVFMLFLACAISYLDRAALSVAAPLIAKDLHLDPAHLGIVFSAFFVGYSLFCFIGGYAADRFGAKRVLVVAIGLWSIFCGLTAAASSLAVLLVIRVIFGAGEGPLATCTNKIISGWFERKEQTTAVGFANSGLQLGAALAGPVVGLMAVHWGWRIPFIVIGVLGVLWVLMWSIFSTDRPEGNRWVRGAMPAGSDAGAELTARESVAHTPLSFYLKSPTIWATSLAYFGYAYILYFFLSWFPSYLMMERHLSLSSMSIVNVIPWILGFMGIALGGFISDRIFRLTGNALKSRKIVIVGGLLIAAACVACAGTANSVGAAVALMGITVFFMNLTLSVYWAIILDTVEPARMGGVGGFMHLLANTAGILAPILTGFLVQWTKVFTSAFLLSGGIALAGALAVAVFVRAPRNISDTHGNLSAQGPHPLTD
ncbi:MFS transporter [Paraburkholderia sp. RP-4-7]|jgi:ACS family hexuronate transporter-like MFS transporter|uniref:MFS transporter n=1 Tax=Paraburkholderia polaris TaxID=2728848 RepID=A0A848ICA2_9BURK|nr:MFS transporter [Paraburkholderia polaris]NML97186.1 MFS transporter [Paraburkholderia polaris]